MTKDKAEKVLQKKIALKNEVKQEKYFVRKRSFGL